MKQEAHKPVIVLDVGRVLVDIDPDRVLTDLSRRSGRELVMPSRDDLDTMLFPLYVGEHSWPETLETVNRALGLSLNGDEWREIWCSIITGEVRGMSQALAELKDDFTLVALSNTDEVHWNYVLDTYPILHLLDGWVVSFEEGMMKPDAAIYTRAANRYCNAGLPFFYTDDSPQFVNAARRLGWDAEVFIDAAHFRQEVSRRRGNYLPY
jgi:2-haloacid dehalogenase